MFQTFKSEIINGHKPYVHLVHILTTPTHEISSAHNNMSDVTTVASHMYEAPNFFLSRTDRISWTYKCKCCQMYLHTVGFSAIT
jgi:hypothetical protein